MSYVYRYVLDIHVPGAELREQLWRNLVPSKLPLDNDVNFWDLAQRYIIIIRQNNYTVN